MVAWQFILMILLSGSLLVFFLYRPIKLTVHDDTNIAIRPLPWAVVIVIFIAISSLLFYDHLKPRLLEKSNINKESTSLQDSVDSLESYLMNHPNDYRSWGMLALAQFKLGEFSSSIESFEKALVINPEDVELLLQYTGVLVAIQDGSLEGKPRIMIQKALKHDPQSIDALYLSGIDAANQGDIIAAEKFWLKALYLIPENSTDRKIVESAIESISEK